MLNIVLAVSLILGLTLMILNFPDEADLLKIRSINKKFNEIKFKTKILLGFISIGLLVAIITKVLIFLLALVLVGIFLPEILDRKTKDKIIEKKMELWIALIEDLTSGARAGLTINEAVFQAIYKAEEPLHSDLQEAILEYQKSQQLSRIIPILKANTKDSVGIATLKIIEIVSKTGANDLSSSLLILSNSAKETHNLIMELKAKQAWVLNGAKISVLAPWLVLLALWSQESVRNSYQQLGGQIILLLVGAVGVLGFFTMKKIGTIRAFERVSS
jgi:tight adherence protein B